MQRRLRRLKAADPLHRARIDSKSSRNLPCHSRTDACCRNEQLSRPVQEPMGRVIGSPFLRRQIAGAARQSEPARHSDQPVVSYRGVDRCDRHIQWVIAATSSVAIANAAFDVAVAMHPNERLMLHKRCSDPPSFGSGDVLISESEICLCLRLTIRLSRRRRRSPVGSDYGDGPASPVFQGPDC
jgi:hypothetical protein